MRSTLIFFLIIIVHSQSSAQTEQKNMIFGGTLDVSYSAIDTIRIFNLSLQPRAGIFVYKNLCLGLGFGVGLTSDNRGKNRANRLFINTNFQPFIRYYFLKQKLRPFLFAQGGYIGSSSLVRGNNANIDGGTFSAGVGLASFVNKSIAIETSLGYTGIKFKEQNLRTTIFLSVGIQYYLQPKFDK